MNKKVVIAALGLYAGGMTLLYVRSQMNLNTVLGACNEVLDILKQLNVDFEFARIAERFDEDY